MSTPKFIKYIFLSFICLSGQSQDKVYPFNYSIHGIYNNYDNYEQLTFALNTDNPSYHFVQAIGYSLIKDTDIAYFGTPTLNNDLLISYEIDLNNEITEETSTTKVTKTKVTKLINSYKCSEYQIDISYGEDYTKKYLFYIYEDPKINIIPYLEFYKNPLNLSFKIKNIKGVPLLIVDAENNTTLLEITKIEEIKSTFTLKKKNIDDYLALKKKNEDFQKELEKKYEEKYGQTSITDSAMVPPADEPAFLATDMYDDTKLPDFCKMDTNNPFKTETLNTLFRDYFSNKCDLFRTTKAEENKKEYYNYIRNDLVNYKNYLINKKNIPKEETEEFINQIRDLIDLGELEK